MSFVTMRKLALRLFSRINLGDIHIKHHVTGDRILVHSFAHKGYWFHGQNREKETLALLQELIRTGSVVVDVGGHIGYMSLIFSHLVGDNGKVIVFEPGENNLPYITHNVSRRPNICLITKAVCDKNGCASFYVENLTGQNNSLFPDYHMFQKNRVAASVRVQYKESRVVTTSLDAFLSETDLRPDFVKMDIEGAEILALRGMSDCLTKHRPLMVIEVTCDHGAIFELLRAFDYLLFLPNKTLVTRFEQLETNSFWNVFCVPSEHAAVFKFNQSKDG
jgi:FkbM family methyltransferase